MTVLGVLLLVLIVAVVRRRRRIKARLAGLEATRPVFSVAPPGGRLGRMKDAAL